MKNNSTLTNSLLGIIAIGVIILIIIFASKKGQMPTTDRANNTVNTSTQANDGRNEFLENVMQNSYGLNKDEYASIFNKNNGDGRLTALRFEGVFKNDSYFKGYYQHSESSSGAGSSNTCFSTNSKDEFTTVKNHICSDIYSYQHPVDSISGQTPVKTFDNTDSLRKECLDGKFDRVDNGNYAISVSAALGHYSHSTSIGSFECVE